MKKIILLAFLIVTIISCKKDIPAVVTPAAPTYTIKGIWYDTNNCYTNIKFNEDKTYLLTAITFTMASGTYAVSSNVVTLTTTEDTGCQGGNVAKYSFVVTATTLKLSLISDPCEQQKSLLTLPFSK